VGVVAGVTGDGVIDHMEFVPGEGPVREDVCPSVAGITEFIGHNRLWRVIKRVVLPEHAFYV
jgi:hypothetical protein